MKHLSILLILFALAVGCASKPSGPKPLSGLAIGSHCEAHHPTHVSGPDKGTDTCPV